MSDSFSPLFVMLLVYLLFGLFASGAKKKAGKAKKQQAAGKVKNPAAEPESAPAAPEAPAESHLTPAQPLVTPFQADDSVYAGSLYAHTGEGEDPCHEDQLQPVSALLREPSEPAASPSLHLSWTGNDIVRGFVMSEILKRK